jgi:hypothetical protein
MKTAMSLQGRGKAKNTTDQNTVLNVQDSPQHCDTLQCFSKTHLIPVAGKDAMFYTFPTNLLDAQKSSMCIGMICLSAALTFNHIEEHTKLHYCNQVLIHLSCGAIFASIYRS